MSTDATTSPLSLPAAQTLERMRQRLTPANWLGRLDERVNEYMNGPWWLQVAVTFSGLATALGLLIGIMAIGVITAVQLAPETKIVWLFGGAAGFLVFMGVTAVSQVYTTYTGQWHLYPPATFLGQTIPKHVDDTVQARIRAVRLDSTVMAEFELQVLLPYCRDFRREIRQAQGYALFQTWPPQDKKLCCVLNASGEDITPP